MTPNSRSGEKSFYTITNEQIYYKVQEMDRSLIRFKAVVYALSLIITPILSSVIAMIVGKVN